MGKHVFIDLTPTERRSCGSECADGTNFESLLREPQQMGAMHLLPGTTFSNVQAKADYPANARAILTLAELEHWLIRRDSRGRIRARDAGLSGCGEVGRRSFLLL